MSTIKTRAATSAVIIPFPAGLPPLAEINTRLADARRLVGLLPSAERLAYITGYTDALLQGEASLTPTPRRRK